MKHFLLPILVLTQTACTSVDKLKSDQVCQVWEDQPILGPNSITVQGNRAEWKGSCALIFFMCDQLAGELDPKTQAITLSGSGLFEGKKKVAELAGEMVTYEKTALDGIVKSSPIEIDMKMKEARRSVKATALVEMTSNQSLNFNASCSKEQAAVGAVTLWASKNRNK